MKTKQLNETFSMTIDGKPVKSFKKIDEKVKSFLGDNINVSGMGDFWNRAIQRFETINETHPDVSDFSITVTEEKSESDVEVLRITCKGIYPRIPTPLFIHSVSIDKDGQHACGSYRSQAGETYLDVLTNVQR